MLPGTLDDKFKTELCVKFLDMGQCPYGLRCRFAHGEEELRAKPKPRPFRPAYNQTGAAMIGGTMPFNQTALPGSTIATGKPLTDFNSGFGVGHAVTDHHQMMSHPIGGVIQRPPGPLDPDTRDELQARATAQWEAMMPLEWMDPSTGLFSLAPLDGYNECRPNISERFQAWKELRAEGPLPDHVLVLKDNQRWREDQMREEDSVMAFLGRPPLRRQRDFTGSGPHPSSIPMPNHHNAQQQNHHHRHHMAHHHHQSGPVGGPVGGGLSQSLLAASVMSGDLNGPAPAPGMGPMVGERPYERREERGRRSDPSGGSRKRRTRDEGGPSSSSSSSSFGDASNLGSSRTRRRRNDDHYDASGSDSHRYGRSHRSGGGSGSRSRSHSDERRVGRKKNYSQGASHYGGSPIPVDDD